MSIPDAYDNTALAGYMERAIGPLSGILELNAADGSFDDAVQATLLAYGVDDAEQADDIRLLLAYADREVWRLARNHTVAYYDLRAPDGEQLSRSQIYRQATERLHEAERQVATLSGAIAPQVHTIRRNPDPYRRGVVTRGI